MYREPMVKERKWGFKSTVWSRRKKYTFQPEPNEETRIQQNKERLRNHNFKRSNIRIIGVTEGEKEKQEIENLFENIMENFPNLAKEIYYQEVQEAQSPKQDGSKEEHTKTHQN